MLWLTKHNLSLSLAPVNGKMLLHRRLCSRLSNALQDSQRSNNHCLYCIASDGDSHRRRAMALLTLMQTHSFKPPIYEILSTLHLFNLLYGKDDPTADPDWKHILKWFRNTLLCLMVIIIDNMVITTAILKTHLLMAGINETAVDALLSPNDKQDVVLMVQLLDSLAQLPPTTACDDLSTQASCCILHLLGHLYRHLLEAYMNPSLSLHQQLKHLSAAAHLMLMLYSCDKGNFIPFNCSLISWP
jgi:hypothetical protein